MGGQYKQSQYYGSNIYHNIQWYDAQKNNSSNFQSNGRTLENGIHLDFILFIEKEWEKKCWVASGQKNGLISLSKKKTNSYRFCRGCVNILEKEYENTKMLCSFFWTEKKILSHSKKKIIIIGSAGGLKTFY